jgi:cell fate (sporulation/competence/biofilm development) regulator YlbF (YheA/YmcA/DUF963 family)
MAETTRPILDRIMDSVKWNITPDSDTTQALKNAFPILANDLDNMDKLTPEYRKEVLTPLLIQLDQKKRTELMSTLGKSKSELHGLVSSIDATFSYVSRKWVSPQKLLNTLPWVVWPKLQEAGDFLTSVSGIQDTNEREQSLLFEVLNRAKKVQAKFDDYVYNGKSQQYGSGGWSIQNWLSWDDLVEFHGAEWKVQAYSEVEDAKKDEIEDILLMLVTKAKNPQDTGVDFSNFNGGKSVNLGSKLNQLAEMASYLDALERGIDDANQWWASSLASLPAEFWVWLAGSLMPSNLTNTATSGAGIILAIALYKKWWLSTTKLKSILWKGWAATSTWAPWATTEWPKTPSRFVEVNPTDLKDFKPGEPNHTEYYKKTLEKIKNLGIAPAIPVAWALAPAPAIVPAEVSTRTAKYMALDAEYRGGKMSLAEYLKRTEDVIVWRGRVLVKDGTGTIDKWESIKNVKQRIMDRTPWVSPFTKNNPNGSATSSVNAIQAAKNRIKGTSYESVDFAGAKIEFADTNAKALFEEFRNKIETYSQMQEWDANDRLIQSKEVLVSQYNADIQSRLVPGTQAHTLSTQIDVLIRTAPTVTTSSVWVHGTTTNVLPNPQIEALMKQLERLNPDIPAIYKKITDLKWEVGDLAGKTLSYRPKTTAAVPAIPGTPHVRARAWKPAVPATPGTPAVPAIVPRQQFQADIRAMKLEISNPIAGSPGLIQRINTHAGSVVIPDTAFNPKDLKLNKITFLEIAKIALKK